MVAEPLRIAETEKEEEVRLWRASREIFFQLADLDAFGENRVEWLNGEIYTAPPPGAEHGNRNDELAELLIVNVRDRFVVRNQNRLQCPRAELAPDLALIRRDHFRRNETPVTAELVIEVSVSSVRYDRDRKAEHYAEAGVNHYWVIDLEHRRVLAFEGPIPAESRYRTLQTLGESDSLTVPGTEFTLTGKQLLG